MSSDKGLASTLLLHRSLEAPVLGPSPGPPGSDRPLASAVPPVFVD